MNPETKKPNCNVAFIPSTDEKAGITATQAIDDKTSTGNCRISDPLQKKVLRTATERLFRE